MSKKQKKISALQTVCESIVPIWCVTMAALIAIMSMLDESTYTIILALIVFTLTCFGMGLVYYFSLQDKPDRLLSWLSLTVITESIPGYSEEVAAQLNFVLTTVAELKKEMGITQNEFSQLDYKCNYLQWLEQNYNQLQEQALYCVVAQSIVYIQSKKNMKRLLHKWEHRKAACQV